MIIVAGSVRTRPERRERVTDLAREMMRASRAEAGCIDYTFSADLEDPDLYWLYEAWESETALAAHFETPHMASFRRLLPDLVAEDPDVRRYQVHRDAPSDEGGA